MTPPRDTIVKAFAEWTAFSSTRSGCPVKSAREIYPFIRLADYRAILSGSAISPREFDAWHRESTMAVCEKSENRLPVGWAAKIINVYLKTRVYIAGEGRSGLIKCIHPPLDGGLWRGIRKVYVEHPDIIDKTHCVTRIKNIQSYETYMTIIEGCRLIAGDRGCFLIEVEELWQGVPAEGAF